MFTDKNSEKTITMQLDLDPSVIKIREKKIGSPESILICSDGSVVVGSGEGEEIQVVYWYPCFEMIPFFSRYPFNSKQYIVSEPVIENISTHYLMTGPLQ